MEREKLAFREQEPAIGNQHVVAEIKYSIARIKSRTVHKNKKRKFPKNKMTTDRKVRKSEAFQHLTQSSVLKNTENGELEIDKKVISKEVP